MRSFLLDTNVLSEVVRKRPEPAVLDALREIPADQLATSVICLAELRFGTARHPNGKELWSRLTEQVIARVRILPVTTPISLRAGDLLADLEQRGEPIGIEDVLIGATALEEEMVVATRNSRHFQRLPLLEVVNWWPSGGSSG